MSPKPRRAQQEVPLATTTTTTTTTATSTAVTGAAAPAPPTNIEPEPEDVKVEEEFKKEVEEDIDADMKENEEIVNEEAAERPIPHGDSEKPVEECPSTTEPPPEGGPSVASRLMSGEGEGDGLSMEGLVMSEDEREGRCDKVTEQVRKA